MKKCTRCFQFKDTTEFYIARSYKNNSDGLRPTCKRCCAEVHKLYREKNKDKLHAMNSKWHKANKSKSFERHKKRRKEIVDNIPSKRHQNQLNYSSIQENNIQWRNANIELIRKKNADYALNKAKYDTNYRLSSVLRSRIIQYLKSGSAVRDLGCTIAELKQHLEKQFQPGMTWDNWSKTGWHIDHIKPLSSFDLTDPDQFRQAAHYTNLQPLWAKDNLKKGSKVL